MQSGLIPGALYPVWLSPDELKSGEEGRFDRVFTPSTDVFFFWSIAMQIFRSVGWKRPQYVM